MGPTSGDPDSTSPLDMNSTSPAALPEQLSTQKSTGWPLGGETAPAPNTTNRNNSDFAPHEQNEAPIALGLPVSDADLSVPATPEDDVLKSQVDRGGEVNSLPGPSMLLEIASSPRTTATVPRPASSRNVSFANAGVNPVSESHAGQSLWSKNWRIAEPNGPTDVSDTPDASPSVPQMSPGAIRSSLPSPGAVRSSSPLSLPDVDSSRTHHRSEARTAGSSIPRAGTISQDIVIPRRLMSVVDKEWSRRSTGVSLEKRRRSSAREGSEVHFDIHRIAQEQSQAARLALDGRSADSSFSAPNRSRLVSFAVPAEEPGRPRGSSGVAPVRTRFVSFAGPTDRLSASEQSEQTKKQSKVNWGSNLSDKPELQVDQSATASRTDLPRDVFWSTVNPFAPSGSDSAFSSGDFSEKIGDANHAVPRKSTIQINDGAQPSHVGSVNDRRRTTVGRAGSIFQTAAQGMTNMARRMTMVDLYEKAKVRGIALQRARWAQLLFEYTFYLILVAIIYFVFIGMPLWKGAVYYLYRVVKYSFVVEGTWAITVGIAFIYAFAPLLILFEKDPPPAEDRPGDLENGGAPGTHDTALLIPCYKAAKIIGPTLECALKIFPASHIFVIANGNSPTPLDNTEEICQKWGVNHVWSPVGSKIVAQFVGCYAAKKFKNVLLIDDDCALPPNFPIVSDRMTDMIKCIGYTIKSVGPESSKGTYCQQAQDLEYKLSGLQRGFAGMIGSATFPHGAISIWDTEFLISTFHHHPGYSVSEDWFFGHVARQLGSRIIMCTSVFVETETPNCIFYSSGGGERGGFGEMSIFKQRFYRWNFFFVNGMFYNLDYVLRSWRLGWWEFGAKLFVLQEVYETLLYLFAPFFLPISLIIRPAFTAYLFAGVFGLYFVNTVIFNEVHLRLKNERVDWKTAYFYYQFYKIVLLPVNVLSCYYALYKYATYFARRHPKIIEDEKAIDVVLHLEEQTPAEQPVAQGRRMTITAIGSRLRDFSFGGGSTHRAGSGPRASVAPARKATLVTFGPGVAHHSISSGPRDRRVTVAALFEDDEPNDPLSGEGWHQADVENGTESPPTSGTDTDRMEELVAE